MLLQVICSLRVKSILLLTIVFLVMMSLFLSILLSVILSSFNLAENNETIDAAKRVTRAITDDYLNQAALLLTYSNWDTSYDLMKEFTVEKMEYRLYWSYGNMEHVKELTGANFIGYYFLNGTAAGVVGYDFESETAEEMPDEMRQLPPVLMKNMNDTSEMNIGYWVMSDETIFLVMVAPIQCGACGFGDITGLMMWAKFVKRSYVKEVANRAQLCVTMYDAHDTTNVATKSIIPRINNMERGISPVYKGELERDKPVTIQTFRPSDTSMLVGRECYNKTTGATSSEEERILFYHVYEDIFGNKSIIFRSDFPRDVRKLGLSSFGWAYGIVSLIVILCSLMMIVLTELLVINPMLTLNSHLRRILREFDTSAIIPVKGIQEISKLTRRINNMLQVVHESYGQLKQDNITLENLLQKVSTEEQKARTLMNSISDFIMIVGQTTDAISLANNSFYNKSRYESGKPIELSKLFKDLELADLMNKIKELGDSDASWTTNLTTKFGRVLPVSVTVKITKMFLDTDEQDVYIIVAHDLSENQQLRERMHNNQEALQSMQAIMEFDKMLRNTSLREDFKQYCQREMSDENILFLEAVEDYRHTSNAHDRYEKQKEIVKMFLDSEGLKPLNISSKVLETAKYDVAKGLGQYDLFDKLEKAIREMIINDTWFRYNKLKKAQM